MGGIYVLVDADVSAAARRFHRMLSTAAARRGRRFHREVMVASAPRWLDDLDWAFPTWRVLKRPFDWAEDEADVPLPAPVPAWELPERRQFEFYLRPAPPTIRA